MGRLGAWVATVIIKGFLSFNLVSDKFLQLSRSALHKAAIKGQHDTVKMLLDGGEDVDKRDEVICFIFPEITQIKEGVAAFFL